MKYEQIMDLNIINVGQSNLPTNKFVMHLP